MISSLCFLIHPLFNPIEMLVEETVWWEAVAAKQAGSLSNEAKYQQNNV